MTTRREPRAGSVVAALGGQCATTLKTYLPRRTPNDRFCVRKIRRTRRASFQARRNAGAGRDAGQTRRSSPRRRTRTATARTRRSRAHPESTRRAPKKICHPEARFTSRRTSQAGYSRPFSAFWSRAPKIEPVPRLRGPSARKPRLRMTEKRGSHATCSIEEGAGSPRKKGPTLMGRPSLIDRRLRQPSVRFRACRRST